MASKKDGESLGDFLRTRVFSKTVSTTLAPLDEDVAGFEKYMQDYKKLLEVEKKAVELF